MNEELQSAILQMNARAAPKQETYVAKDGLRYCGNCHTPVQCRVMLLGAMRTVNCLCQCQKEERKRQKEAEETKIRMQAVRRLKSAGIQEKLLRDWRFEEAEETESIRWAKNYVSHWEQVREENLGLWLWGDVGTGKTFVAACIANALLEKGVPVLMTNFSKILNQTGSLYSEERVQYFASFHRYPLLIIDDLGMERCTDYAKEQVYAVIDERYKANLPLIVTSNLTIGEIRHPANLADARIYSRILAMCTPVHVHGIDRRQPSSRKKQELVRSLLFQETEG